MLHGSLCIQKHFRGLHSRQGYQRLKKGAMNLQSCNTLYFFLFKTFLNSNNMNVYHTLPVFQTAVIRGERARIHFDNLVKRWRAAVLIQKYTRRRLAANMFNDQLSHIILLQSGNLYDKIKEVILTLP